MAQAFMRLGLSVGSGNSAANDQGIDTIEELRRLKDSDVDELCKAMRRPGGYVANPNAGQDGQPPLIANPGHAVNLRTQNNIKFAAYWLRLREKTSRPTTPQDITVNSVRSIEALREWELNHGDNPEAPEGIIDANDWPKTMESLEEYLKTCLGDGGTPLAYVVRKEQEVPNSADDPETNYDSKQDEMIARSPHVDGNNRPLDTYKNDRRKVFEILLKVTDGLPSSVYVKRAQRGKDGRQAFLNLYGHYLGRSNVDNMATLAERKLQSLTYTGELRRFNFEKYVTNHVHQHLILTNLVEHGYSGIDERSKVRHLLDGIKTDKLDSVRTRIFSDEILQNDFDASVSLFKDFIKQAGDKGSQTLNISSLKEGDEQHTKHPVRFRGQVEDRYYTKEEYRRLSDEQKDHLRKLRKDRGHNPKKRKREGGQNLMKKIQKMVVAAIHKERDADGGPPTEDGRTNGGQGGAGNRQNPNLTRQARNA